jgi:hypothetical protein
MALLFMLLMAGWKYRGRWNFTPWNFDVGADWARNRRGYLSIAARGLDHSSKAGNNGWIGGDEEIEMAIASDDR